MTVLRWTRNGYRRAVKTRRRYHLEKFVGIDQFRDRGNRQWLLHLGPAVIVLRKDRAE
jgi:hypothetical protein